MTPNEIKTFAMTVTEFCERHGIPLEYYEHDQEYYLRANITDVTNPTIHGYLKVIIHIQHPNSVCILDADWLVYRLGTVFDLIQNPGKTIVTAAERLRASLPNLIASEIVGVQPMDCTLGAVSTLITQNSKDDNTDQGTTHDQ